MGKLRKTFIGIFFAVILFALVYNIVRELIEDNKTAEAVKAISLNVDSEDFVVRKAAVDALAKTGHRSVLEEISARWKKEPSPAVVVSMLQALAATEQSRAIPVIREIWETWRKKPYAEQFPENDDPRFGNVIDVESAVIRALVSLNNPESISMFLEVAGPALQEDSVATSEAFKNLPADTRLKVWNALAGADSTFESAKDENDMTGREFVLLDSAKVEELAKPITGVFGSLGYFEATTQKYNQFSKWLKSLDQPELIAMLEASGKLAYADKRAIEGVLAKLKTASLAKISFNELKASGKEETVHGILAILAKVKTEDKEKLVAATPSGRLALALNKDISYRGELIKAFGEINRSQLEKLFTYVVWVDPSLTPKSEMKFFAHAFQALTPAMRGEYITWLKANRNGSDAKEGKKGSDVVDVIAKINDHNISIMKEITSAANGIPQDLLVHAAVSLADISPVFSRLYPERGVVDSKLARDGLAGAWMTGAADSNHFKSIISKIPLFQFGQKNLSGDFAINDALLADDGDRKKIASVLGDKSLYKTLKKDEKPDLAIWTKALFDSNLAKLALNARKEYAIETAFKRTLSKFVSLHNTAFVGTGKIKILNASVLIDLARNSEDKVTRALAIKHLVATVKSKRIVGMIAGIMELEKTTVLEKRIICTLAPRLGKGPEVLQILAKGLKSESPIVVESAAKSSGTMANSALLPETVEATESHQGIISLFKSLTAALAKLTVQRSEAQKPSIDKTHKFYIDLLQKAKDDETQKICLEYFSKQNKGELPDDDGALTKLISKLFYVKKGLRGAAIDALGIVGSDYAVATLAEIFDFKDVVEEKDKQKKEVGLDKALKAKIAEAWGKSGNKLAISNILNKALTDRDDTVREKAASALGNIKDESSIEALINILKNPQEMPAVFNAAMGSLPLLKKLPEGQTGSFKRIVDMMQLDPTKDSNLRLILIGIEAYGLGLVGEDINKNVKRDNVVKYLYPMFDAKYPPIVRIYAADAINAFSDRKFVNKMGEFAKADDDEVTIAKLCIGIEGMREPRVRRHLEEKLAMCDPNKSPMAVVALTRIIGIMKGLKTIDRLVKWSQDSSLPLTIRLTCIEAWKTIDNVNGLDNVMELSKNDKDSRIRYAAIGALEKYSVKKVLDNLVGIMDNKDELPALRALAAGNLTKAQDKRVFAALQNALAKYNSEIRIAIANAISAVHMPHYYPFYNIHEALNDKTPSAVIAICGAMAYVDYSPHREALAKLYTHGDRGVRDAAEKAVSAISGERTGDVAMYLKIKVETIAKKQEAMKNGEIDENWAPIK